MGNIFAHGVSGRRVKVKRAPIRAAFTRKILNDLKAEVNNPEGNLDLIKELKRRLEDRFQRLEKNDEDIDMQEIGASDLEQNSSSSSRKQQSAIRI